MKCGPQRSQQDFTLDFAKIDVSPVMSADSRESVGLWRGNIWICTCSVSETDENAKCHWNSVSHQNRETLKDAWNISEHLTDLLMRYLFQLASDSLEYLSQVCHSGHRRLCMCRFIYLCRSSVNCSVPGTVLLQLDYFCSKPRSDIVILGTSALCTADVPSIRKIPANSSSGRSNKA